MTHYPGMNLKKEEFYSFRDFIIGKTIKVFSRDCLISNCDDFTKKWYREK